MLTQLAGGRLGSPVVSAAGTPLPPPPPPKIDLLQDHFGMGPDAAPPWQLAPGGGDIDAAAAAAGASAEYARYEDAAEVLDSLPMAFLRFHGSTDVDRVLDALDYAVSSLER
jgi:hypothetical protein